jgi:diguanylate cyclase (GGDEF)-like protein/PAS domain S-box-containing protein
VSADRRLQAQYVVSHVLAESATLGEAAPRLLEGLCRALDWQFGALWEVLPGGEDLRRIAVWTDPALGNESSPAGETLSPSEAAGLPRQVWARREAVWSADVAQDSDFAGHRPAAEAGLRAAFGFPILLGNEVLGAIEARGRAARAPDRELLRTVESIGCQIGQFVDRTRTHEAARQSAARQSAFLESALDCVLTMDRDGLVVEFNAAAEATFGYDRHQVIGLPLSDLIIPPRFREAHRDGLARYLATGQEAILGRRVEMTAMRADGTEFPVELAVTLVELPGPPMFTAYIRDVTERKRAEETARRLAAIVESSDDAIIGTTLNGIILTWNGGARRIYGYSPDEAIGRSVTMLAPPDRAGEIPDILDRLRAGGRIDHYETVRLRKDGARIDISLSVSPIRDGSGKVVGVSAVSQDIRARKSAERQMAFLAYHDGLTGLPNRAMFEELLALALARARRNELSVAVLYVDVDNFKLVNDSLGHDAGDELLRQIADRLMNVSRETDVVARLGGDEFMLLLSDVQRSGDVVVPGAEDALLIAETVAGRIHNCLSTPFELADTEFYVSASIGISVFPLDAEDARSLLKNADAAMYRSKKRGPGGYMAFPTEKSDENSKLALATRLRRSVEHGDWVLHYQPILALSRGDVVGVEALLRWNDGARGLIAPGDFIPLAEEMGLIETIGEWILDELCRQTTMWRQGGLDLEVSFNLSARQLWHPDLIQTVLSHLDRTALDPHRLVIEITESAAMTDPDRTQQILDSLRRRGVRFAIDDFGTGYSSLSRLKDLPVDVLKIDQSFIREIPGSPPAEAVVRAIIQLAHILGMASLAEGIETEAQWRFLVENDCRLGQGFLFSEPVSGEKVAQVARANQFRMAVNGDALPSPRSTPDVIRLRRRQRI